MTSRSGAGVAQPPAGAFQLEDEEDEVEGTAVAAPVSSPHVQFTSPFAAVASVSRASSVAEEDAESRRACCQVWTQIWLCDKNCCHGTCHQQTLHACSGSLLKATLYASAHATTWRPTDRVAVMMQRIAVRGGTAVQWDRWSRQRDRVTAGLAAEAEQQSCGG